MTEPAATPAPVMPQAKLNKEYAVRGLLFGALLLGFGLWSLYDGVIGYPEHNLRAQKYQELIDAQRQEEWPAVAKANDWKTEKPGAAHNAWDIRTQFIMASIFGFWGLGALTVLALRSRRRFSADTAGLHGFRAAPVPYAAITAVDLAKWQRKGIAKIDATVDGRSCRLVLDDWYFKGMDTLLDAVREQRPELFPAEEPPAPEADNEPAADDAQPPPTA
ncbi:MAG: hypothetical protein WC708_10435 [Lentisphaeria bacterium]